MPQTQRTLVEVVVGILYRQDGAVLLSSRPAGKPYAGYWEFAGGKVESGETLFSALQREFQEELGVTILGATPWLTKIHDYEHARVHLHFFRVGAGDWQGPLQAREGQEWCWQQANHYTVSPMLPANAALLTALSIPSDLSGSLNTGFQASSSEHDFRVQPWRAAEKRYQGLLVASEELGLAQQHYPVTQIWAVCNNVQQWPLLQDVAAVVWPVNNEADNQALLALLHEGVSIPVLPLATKAMVEQHRVFWCQAGIHGCIVDDTLQVA
ncbi:NUDIX domain-containing protein [Snodgrassella sp. CFCC 13594]|uniref:NUDIX domain-containing protein n=1 Tax=Snodgrassella sp. CFCC 13594 TaxID=1775559 RepID=UPI00083025F5|nr:NUDIX domain-containing protein [Snodgrassella sp. CFCC 13594]